MEHWIELANMEKNTTPSEILSKDFAEQELNRWLEIRDISATKREELEDSNKDLIEAIQKKLITIDDNGGLIQKLKDPLDSIDSIEYESRLSVRQVRLALKRAEQNDDLGKMINIAASFSSVKNTKMWDEFSFRDLDLASKIVSYFLA